MRKYEDIFLEVLIRIAAAEPPQGSELATSIEKQSSLSDSAIPFPNSQPKEKMAVEFIHAQVRKWTE